MISDVLRSAVAFDALIIEFITDVVIATMVFFSVHVIHVDQIAFFFFTMNQTWTECTYVLAVFIRQCLHRWLPKSQMNLTTCQLLVCRTSLI